MSRIHFLFFALFGGCSSMPIHPKPMPYLDWEPALQAEDAFRSSTSFTYITTDSASNVYWVEPRPEEAGRNVLMQRLPGGAIRELTPKPYNVRSRVIEYGGCPYVADGDFAYFTNFSDQRIYRVSVKNPGEITAITPEKNADGSLGKYAEPAVSPDGRWLVFSYEKKFAQGEPPNLVGILDLSKPGVQEASVLVKGADFYQLPRFSPDGSKLAWREWNHPYMPWDSTRLVLAEFHGGELRKGSEVTVAGSDHTSIWDHYFGANGELFYVVDFAEQSEESPKNYYNVHGYLNGKDRAITKALFEYQYLRADGNDIVSTTANRGVAGLVRLSIFGGSETQVTTAYVDFGPPALAPNGNVYVQAFSADRPAELAEITPSGEINVLKKAAESKLRPGDISPGEPIEFPTSDGKKSYGYFYPPRNANYSAPSGEKPPVRVLVHGGPVGSTIRAFGLARMYWTSQGYAIFDVNYRGSTGFGRQYRDAIKQKWGLIEVQDVKDGLEYLRREGRISEDAVISGGSAGGYTVQRALTYFPDLFATGASHFGIGNLVTLQKLTHKFESHYLEQLIGGTLESNLAEYEARSPINHLSRLKAPMIIFQGTDDKVVPPENSREMARILAEKGIEHEYYEYAGEGHGFRSKENLVGSLEKESRFFKRVLKAKRRR